jgi:hypothetical protein
MPELGSFPFAPMAVKETPRDLDAATTLLQQFLASLAFTEVPLTSVSASSSGAGVWTLYDNSNSHVAYRVVGGIMDFHFALTSTNLSVAAQQRTLLLPNGYRYANPKGLSMGFVWGNDTGVVIDGFCQITPSAPRSVAILKSTAANWAVGALDVRGFMLGLPVVPT